MFWEDLSIKEKSDLMRLYISNGIMDLDSIKKHYNSFATGGTLPDHDPKNPYHYHNNKGEKVVVTPDDWKANVGKPYFKEIEAAVRAEQAAYPGPEYENNPDFVRDLRSVYKNNMGNDYQNYRYFASALPQGYSFTDEGLIVDPQGNYYVQSGFKQSPRFTYDSDSPLQFTINKGKPIEKTLTFYPVDMDRRVKTSLPVDNTLNIEAEKEKIMQSLNNTYSVDASILGHGFQGNEYESYPVPKGAKIVGNRLVTSDKSILDNLIRNARKNRPDYNNWNIKTNEASIVIPANPTVTRDGQFTHIDFSTGQPVIKQQSDFNFQAGGKLTFKQWKSQMQSKYPDIEMDNTKAGYDYVRYFNNNYDDAIRQLSKLGHFPDTYKLPNHKTFSNESIYSRGPMMGGNWVNDSTFSPSIINRQQYPNIYKEDRLYTEREIYGNKYQQGGHLYQEGGPTNNKSDWAKAHEVKLALQQLGWGNPNNKLHSDYAAKDSNGYYAGYNLKPVTVRPSVQQQLRDWGKNNPKVKGIVEYVDPDIVAENNTMGLKLWGALAGVKAPIKSAVRRQLLRPTETLMGIGGGYGTDKIIQGFTDYNSWGDMLAGEVFNSDNPLLQLGLEFTNPTGYLGGLYGHSIDKKLTESIVRFGEPVKHIANNLIYNISTEKSLPKAIFRTVGDFNDRLDGSKGKILNYVLNPFVKSDYKYKIPAFTYSGAQQSDEINALRPFIGDPVDVFFGHSRFGNYKQIEVPRKYIQWAENKGLSSKKIKAYDLQEVSPLTITSGKGEVSSEGLLPVRRSLDKFRINDRGTRMLEDSRGIAVTSQKPVLDPGGFNFDYQIGDTKFYSDIWKYNGLDGFNRYILKEPSAKYIKPLVTYFGDFIDTQGSPFVTTFFTNPSQIGTLIRK